MFISSTINGYEGTGRSLSLKLFKKLRGNSATSLTNKNALGSYVPSGASKKDRKSQPPNSST